MKRQRAELQGRKGEDLAAEWLKGQGWELLAHRVKTPRGEIDLIARKKKTLFGPDPKLIGFFEVKWRAKQEDLDLAIDEYRLRRVAAAVECVAHEYATQGEDITIDVLLLAPGHPPRHIANAWQP